VIQGDFAEVIGISGLWMQSILWLYEPDPLVTQLHMSHQHIKFTKQHTGQNLVYLLSNSIL